MSDLPERVLPVLVFLAAATVLAGTVAAAGVFDVAASRAARLGAGRPWRLLALVVMLATATTVLLSLDTTVVLLTPVALALAAAAGLSPWPFALATVWLAGTASTLLPVSNLTNLLAADRVADGALGFAHDTGAAWAVSVAVTVAVLCLVSRSELRGRYAVPAPYAAPDRLLFRAAVVAVAAFTCLVVAGVPAAVCAVVTAVPLAVLGRRRDGSLRPLALVPWRLVAGVTALFAAVVVLAPHGLDAGLRDAVGGGGALRTAAVGAGAGSLADNLPAYLALERVVPDRDLPALLLGVDAGTLLTPWGSLATLLWAGALRQAGLRVPWRRFLLGSALLVPLVLLAAAPLLPR